MRPAFEIRNDIRNMKEAQDLIIIAGPMTEVRRRAIGATASVVHQLQQELRATELETKLPPGSILLLGQAPK